MPRDARFIILSGPAASGKTTIAKRLSTELDLPHLSKDAIKSAIMENIDPNVIPIRQIGNAAVGVLLTVAAQMNEGAIIDNVWRRNQAAGLRNLHGHCVEIFCSCDRTILEKRYASRVRPSVYVPEHLNKNDLWSPETIRPIGGFPLITIDTANSIDFSSLIKEINRLWIS